MDERTDDIGSSDAWHHMNTSDFNVMHQNITDAQKIYRTFIVTLGIFLNGVVLFVVTFSRQLRYPRHVFWAAISFFECLFLGECVLELMVVFNHNQLACQVFVLLCPVVYSTLLLCLSMAAFDRYWAIVRYEWYKTSVTNELILLLLAAACVLSFVIINGPFWTGYLSIYTCTVNLYHVHWVLVWDLLLGIIGVVLHVKIFIESKSVIRQYMPVYRQTPITVKFVNYNHRPSNCEPTAEATCIAFPQDTATEGNENTIVHPAEPQLPPSFDHLNAECFPWIPGSSKYNRLEVRAALDMSVNILPFWLCTFPVSCHGMALYWCVKLEGDCQEVFLVWTYMWDLFMLHSIYNPVMYMSTSTEFRRAILHILKKLTNKFQTRDRQQ